MAGPSDASVTPRTPQVMTWWRVPSGDEAWEGTGTPSAAVHYRPLAPPCPQRGGGGVHRTLPPTPPPPHKAPLRRGFWVGRGSAIPLDTILCPAVQFDEGRHACACRLN